MTLTEIARSNGQHTNPIQIPQRTNIFAPALSSTWAYKYDVELCVSNLHGGIPSDPKLVEGWLRTKLVSKDVALETVIAETMAERQISRDDAVEAYIQEGHNTNGFKRIDGNLVIEGRCLKAALKEAFNVTSAGGHFGFTPEEMEQKKAEFDAAKSRGEKPKALPKKRTFGETGKGVKAFVAEHVMVPERFVVIRHEDGTPFTQPTDVEMRFVHTFRGNAISHEEYCDPAILQFQVWSDVDLDRWWPTVWSIGAFQGVGSTRSQGCGTYFVSKWDRI